MTITAAQIDQYNAMQEASENAYRLDRLEAELSACRSLAVRILDHLTTDADRDQISNRANVLALQSNTEQSIATGAGSSSFLLSDRFDQN